MPVYGFCIIFLSVRVIEVWIGFKGLEFINIDRKAYCEVHFGYLGL